MHEVQNLRNRLKFQRTIRLKERNSIGAPGENFLQPSLQLVEPHSRLVDPDRTIRRNLNDDCFGWIIWDPRVCLLRSEGLSAAVWPHPALSGDAE